MSQRLVVIGGDAAGMSAASQARRNSPASELEIVAFERGEFTSYSACGLPYYVGGLVEDVDDLVARSPEQHRENGIDVRIGHEVTEIDVDARRVTIRRVTDDHITVEPFDQLLVATGASPVRPDIPGADSVGIHGIQTITDGIALREHVVKEGCRKAIVVGGGYVGLEMAEAMTRAGLDVVLVDRSPQPMNSMDPDMGALVAEALRGLGVDVHVETGVTGFESRDGHVTAVVTENGTFPADIVVLGLGVKPNSGIAREAGIPVGVTDGIITDRRMATNIDGIWAAGDCVESFHRVSHRPVAIALGTHANKQGKVAGENIAGGYAAFPGVIGTAVTKVCDLEVARTGLSERQAHEAGFEFVVGNIESTTRAHYYPDNTTLHIKVIADARTGVMLGAQIVGREGAAKRIDVLATAIWTGMGVEEFAMLDLAYAPPYSPVWDPTLIAARSAMSGLASRRSA